MIRRVQVSETTLLALVTASEAFLDTTRKLGIDTKLQSELVIAVTEANFLLGLDNLHVRVNASRIPVFKKAAP
jgi:hypothetical protein